MKKSVERRFAHAVGLEVKQFDVGRTSSPLVSVNGASQRMASDGAYTSPYSPPTCNVTLSVERGGSLFRAFELSVFRDSASPFRSIRIRQEDHEKPKVRKHEEIQPISSAE